MSLKFWNRSVVPTCLVDLKLKLDKKIHEIIIEKYFSCNFFSNEFYLSTTTAGIWTNCRGLIGKCFFKLLKRDWTLPTPASHN